MISLTECATEAVSLHELHSHHFSPLGLGRLHREERRTSACALDGE